MTAIASIYTPEGFVIGADGRRIDESRGIVSDSEIKIFGGGAANVRIIFGWTGCSRMQVKSDIFDFKSRSLELMEQFKNQEFNTLADFITAFSLKFYEQLITWVSGCGYQFRQVDNPTWSRLQMVGFVNGSPALAEAHFPFLRGLPMKPGLVQMLEEPTNHFKMFAGKTSVYQSMYADGLMLPCKDLRTGKELVEGYIQRCAGEPEPTNQIGGKIHIAAITPLSTFWMVPPNP
jgi:hypothetical protein